MTVVICVRDPDASNEYRVFGDDVEIIDVDLGYADLSDPEEWAEWKASQLMDVRALEVAGEKEAAEYLRSLIDQIESNYGHDEEVESDGSPVPAA
jgi:hypothetical protein